MTIDGDGTVVVPSALWTAMNTGVEKYWVDLKSYGADGILHSNINRKHADILEIAEVLELLRNVIVRNGNIPENYIKSNKPINTTNIPNLRFTLHSPLTLDLYDSEGNHTGISTTGEVEENIPGSRYLTFGEVKYISVPKTANLHLEMKGYAAGSFTLDVEEANGETTLNKTSFAGIPSRENTNVTMELSNGLTNSDSLLFDENGDGTTDLSLLPVRGGKVTYSSFAITIMPPVNADGTSVFKLGSTVPVKFQLKDANGNLISTAIARIYVAKISNGIPGAEMEAVSTSAATTGNLFRYYASSKQYIFNLETKSLSTGIWQIRIALGNGSSKAVNMGAITLFY
jgi:hypothetical protein